MRNWLFNLATGASLTVFVLALVAWARSQFAIEDLEHEAWNPATRIETKWQFLIDGGRLEVARWVNHYAPGARTPWFPSSRPGFTRITAPRREELSPDQWFLWYPPIPRPRYDGVLYEWNLVVHLLLIALPAAILPVLRLRTHLRDRRAHRAGRCPSCGYDLRATPDRCPECGMPAHAREEAVTGSNA